jgi:hypothetical protein
MKRTLTAAAVLISALALSACGGDDGGDDGSGIPGGADPEAAQVIDDWSQALSDGDVEGAADYFALPSIAQNGTPVANLETREDVVAFNKALPCGATLTEAETEGRFTIGTFELDDRPGGDCGRGVGGTARTAFVIEDGKITEWLRAPDGTVLPPSDSPVV